MKSQSRLSTSAGHYLPSFFKMEVFTDESLVDIDNLSTKTAAIYFHEYLHYMQDVSTFHGLSNMIRMGEYLHHAIRRVGSGPTHFEVPVNPERYSEGVATTVQIIRVLNGDADTGDHAVQIDHIEYLDSSPIASHGDKVPAIVITYNGNKTYNFGSIAIMDSMAWLGEQHLFPDSIAPPLLPYFAAELVAKFVYPEFAKDKLNIFALCDLALLTGEPGAGFYRKLLKMKNAQYLPKHPGDVYKYFENDVFDHRGMKLNRSGMLSSLVHDANIYLSGYFPGNQYSANVDWMKHITLYGFSLRHHNMAFPLDILLEGSFYENKHLKQIMRYIGSPLQLNSEDRATYIIINAVEDKDFRPDLNWAIAEVQKVFLDKRDGCQMKTFCKESAHLQNIPDFTDDNCSTNPWCRVNQGKTCSFVDIIKLWGLQDKMPNRKT